MRRTLILVLVTSLSSVLSIDLVAVYKNDVLLLRDVDKAQPDTVMDWESLILSVPTPFSYPIGVTYDPDGRRLFVADAMQKDTKIFSLTIDANYKVQHMQPVVKTTNTTVMEDLTYDPRTRQLYWTDSFNHGVYKTVLPDEQKGNLAPEPEPAHVFGNVVEPRGIAIDYCNEKMYWSERDGSGNVPSTIEMCDLNGPSHTVVQQGGEGEDEIKIYYQGLTYDMLNGKLLWAETIGDLFDKSYCRIVSYEFGQSAPEREVLVSLENCYPFSLITDEKYIYWADWGQQGIMRASRSNPDDVIKLVHAPQTDTKYGGHHGVYGLAILDGPTDDTIKEVCKGKSNSKSKDMANQKESENVNHDAIDLPYTDTELKTSGNKEMVENGDPVELSYKKLESYMEGDLKGADTSVNSQSNQELQYVKDDSNMGEHDIHYTTEYVHTQSLLEQHGCIENELLLVVSVLAVCCVIFMSSTAILLFKLWSQNGSKHPSEESPTVISEKASNHQPRKPKRFGPKIKSSISGQTSCPGSTGNDGVSINIEDCCQMTLCDTPCYTSVKKEGRGYKSSSLRNKKSDDNTGLLDDTDDFTHC